MQAHSFGNWLKTRRKARDLTQSELADQVGCSAAAIRKLEAEERRPSAQIVERLTEIFEIPQNEQANFLRFARGEVRSVPADTKEDFPWQASIKSPRYSLPATVTSLIGREKVVDEVHALLLKPEIRLVTLIGPPGIGKTRLSIESARTSLQDFPDGVFFIALAPLDDPSLIVLTVAQALHFVEMNRPSATEQLSEGIRDKQMLLVLDNCEHLIEDVASLVTFLLSTCPRLKILTTSRESLRVPGEWLFTVPAFDLPAEHNSVDVENVSQYPALMLFTERARAVRADFSLTSENIGTVAAICARLDGLPLVIELMAARMRFMSPQELLDRLTGHFVLTADGMRAASERQKTLQYAIDWSYQLLQPEEQQLFACLSVYAGSFSLETVEYMLSEKSMRKPVPDLVASLLDKSLLKRASDFESSHEVRYTMLVTLREYARNRLQEMGEETDVRNRHLMHYLGLAEKASHELRGPDQAEWLRQLAGVRDDLRSALDWAIETQQTETALQMGSYLSWFWIRRSDLGEGRRWMEKVTNLPDVSQYPHWYVDVLAQLALCTWLQVGRKQARPYIEQALPLARILKKPHTLANALMVFGFILVSNEDFASAQAALEESIALFEKTQDPWSAALALNSLGGSVFERDDQATGLELSERALAKFHELGDRYFQSVCLRQLGRLRARQGNFQEGLVEVRLSVELSHALGTRYETATGMLLLAKIEQQLGAPLRAVRLYYAAKNILDSIGAWLPEDLEERLAVCRAALSAAEFETAAKDGQSMTMEQVITYALEDQK